MKPLNYLNSYPQAVQDKVSTLLNERRLANYLTNKYPNVHQINNNDLLREYVLDIKNRFLKKSAPLSQICFDNKIHVINNALGLHTYRSKVHGNKIKAKNDIKIASLFKATPEPFLQMIAVHELAHLKEKEHNKAFYQLCQHMMSDYHQVEFDLRVYLLECEHHGDPYL
ncbi:YgjP-like metallopeptidase domain-containing protein [Thalassotalea maritima]|uniref:YgjP-like metallopeptidase domain-containing protein n=1 Tax=Thalassotalea maritima TaxID=3242416 RepID=UPI003527A2E4